MTALPACAVSPRDANAYARAGLGALDRQSATSLAIARANPALDQGALAAFGGALDAGAGASNAELGAVAARLKEQEQVLHDVLRTIGAFVMDQLPVGSTVRELAAIIGRRLGETQTAADAPPTPAPIDAGALRAEVLAAVNEMGFGPEQIAQVERMAADDGITSVLTPAAGGSGLLVGLIALLRIVYGKSRSQGEIDELWERVARVERTPVTTQGGPTPPPR
jgi:hypothetical protein